MPDIPNNITDLAIEQQLGDPVAVVPPRRQGWHVIILNLIIGVPLIPVGFGIWLLWHVFRSPMVNKTRAARRLYIYDRGFVLAADPATQDIWRWDAIDTIYKQIHRSSSQQMIKQVFYSYHLTSVDGRTVKLDGFWENMGEVGYHISVQAACAALPRMREALAAGTEVQFGPIAVSVNGIRHGKKTVPWSDVIAVELPYTSFSVKVKDRFSLFAVVSVHLIPNLRLLEILANELRTGRIVLEGDVVRG